MKLKTYRRTGAFTLVEIMIVVAIIGLLAAIAIPNFVRARTTAQTNACINNLRQIAGAIQQWALENNAAPGAEVDEAEVVRYLGRNPNATSFAEADVVCPAGGTYTVTTVDADPTCNVEGHELP